VNCKECRRQIFDRRGPSTSHKARGAALCCAIQDDTCADRAVH
jgi:hypothetical protein